nr:Hpt domain-containing protein [Deinococcus sp. JMULE3]
MFAEEARAQLDTLDAALHHLEDHAGEPAPGSGEGAAIRAAFQAAHSIKGGAAMLDLRGVQLLMSALEDLLAHLRAGRAAPPGWLSAAFHARDRLIRQLEDLSPGAPAHPDDETAAQALRDLLGVPGSPAPRGAQHPQAGHGAAPDQPARSADQPSADQPSADQPSADQPSTPAPAPPRAVVMDVSALSRDALAAHLRRLGYDVHTHAQVPAPVPATLVLLSATFLNAALRAGWPPGTLHVLSEDPDARADARARGLHASGRPTHDAPTSTLPGHWTPTPTDPQ